MGQQRRVLSAVLVATAAIALAGCTSPQQTAADSALATYRGGEVTPAEFDAHVESQAAAGRSLTEGEGDWRVTVLEGIAVSEIAARAAPDDPSLDTAIEAATGPILEASMRERLGWDNVSVGAEEVRRFYDEHPEIFVDPEKLRLQHIFLRAEEGVVSVEERAAIRRRLEGIRRQILDGADFAAMAKQHSDSADGPAGGWMVLKRGARAVRSFTEVAWALEENEISESIDTPTGFHIARLATRVAPLDRPFEDVRQFVTDETLKGARRKIEQAFLTERGPQYDLQRNYEVLKDRDIQDDTALFSIDGKAFTVRDLLATVPANYLPHFYTGYLRHFDRFLDQQALSRILVREARAEGLENDEAIREAVDRAAQEIRANFELERRLTELNEATSNEELLEFYEQNKNRYETLRTRSLSVIRLAPDPDRTLWALLKDGEKLVDEIRGGADFAELARSRSQHVSASDGGRLLDYSDDAVRMRVQGRARGRQIVDALEVGEVSKAFVGEVYDPHKLRYEPTGVYIVRLDGETPPRQAPFEEVEELIRVNYLRRYYSRFLGELKSQMLAEAEFEIVEANLPELGD